MIVTFTNPVNLVIRPQTVISAISENVFAMKIMQITDNPVEKKVTALVKGGTGHTYTSLIVLWSGQSYDAVGQWTDTDAINRVKFIYENQ